MKEDGKKSEELFICFYVNGARMLWHGRGREFLLCVGGGICPPYGGGGCFHGAHGRLSPIL